MLSRYGKSIEITDIPLSKRYVNVNSDNVNTSNNYYLKPYENVVEVDSSDIGADSIVYLPDVGEVAGLTFDVFTPDVGTATNKVEVMDKGGTQLGNDLDADNDYITVLSTGLHWRVLANSAA